MTDSTPDPTPARAEGVTPDPAREPARLASVRVRRTPRLASFLVAGLGFGVVLALVATFAFPPNEEFATSQVFGFLLLIGAVIGTALGAVVALIVGRVLDGRAREVAAERENTPPATDS